MDKHFITSPNQKHKSVKTALKCETLANVLKLYKSPGVDAFEELTELDMSNCDLVEITCGLRKLRLKKLNLSKNKLTQVPRCFYLGLEQLEFLDISFNMIPCFEVEPNCYRTLQVLILTSNKLKDIPQWIMNHRAIKLKELCYDLNKITSLRCIFGSNMYFSVPKLSLKNCILRDEDCNFLKNCRYLEELDISNAKDSDLNINMITTIDKFLYQPNLQNLSILKMNNLLLSIFPEGLTWFEGLSELHLMNNNLTWLPKDGLEFFVNLEVLNLSHNIISYLPEKLSWLIDLKVLNLSYNSLETLCDFSKMKSLEILDLYSNNIEDVDHDFININLKGLDIEMNYFDSEDLNLPFYQRMKNTLRMSVSEMERDDGTKKMPERLNSWRSGDSYSSSEVSEDWDEEIRIQEQITASDDEWTGESPISPYIPISHYEKPSIYNDDVIFCDAD